MDSNHGIPSSSSTTTMAVVTKPSSSSSTSSPSNVVNVDVTVENNSVQVSSTTPTLSDATLENESACSWKQIFSNSIREGMVNKIVCELQRITGKNDLQHLQYCANRYESIVWKKCILQSEYFKKIEQRIQSLRAQSTKQNNMTVPKMQRLTIRSRSHRSRSKSDTDTDNRRSRHRHRVSHTMLSSEPLSPSSISRDQQYFARLRTMKTMYRDEIALVFRELCRVNTVIHHSSNLRRHESNTLEDFLTNLKKVIYLLEQQPDEMYGMIPQRKRTLEYLDVVESHIQRKVLPILNRLRHTYSTILRPLVLNYLRNCTRGSRRL